KADHVTLDQHANMVALLQQLIQDAWQNAAFEGISMDCLGLASANKLPDLRGEFIRGWDDGRGIDAGRVLLSIQAGMLEKHRHPVV
ncbi:YcjX family protein, partial [Salmonella enterica subsp. enterica serovar Montevideo]|nr:YcjX family protein [Salmonella enterica subsp. enterica serovar Montevideo]